MNISPSFYASFNCFLKMMNAEHFQNIFSINYLLLLLNTILYNISNLLLRNITKKRSYVLFLIMLIKLVIKTYCYATHVA